MLARVAGSNTIIKLHPRLGHVSLPLHIIFTDPLSCKSNDRMHELLYSENQTSYQVMFNDCPLYIYQHIKIRLPRKNRVSYGLGKKLIVGICFFKSISQVPLKITTDKLPFGMEEAYD